MVTLSDFVLSAELLRAINASPELRRRIAAKVLELQRAMLLRVLMDRSRRLR
jgi:hypothetical protein